MRITTQSKNGMANQNAERSTEEVVLKISEERADDIASILRDKAHELVEDRGAQRSRPKREEELNEAAAFFKDLAELEDDFWTFMVVRDE